MADTITDTIADTPTAPVTPPGRPDHPGAALASAVAYVAIVLTGAIFGFFFAWVCSTMWGLDAADPRVAIVAMQEMNASVRNAVFFPAFFLTPVALFGAGWALRRTGRLAAWPWFAAAGGVYLVGGLLLTALVNVPMNEDLADVVVPTDLDAAARIWEDYSGRWQRWNLTRTIASGVALLLAAIGLRRSARAPMG
ncbi:MAG: DUF1772 domain-containing protein [Desertimonas sp.]